MTRYASYSERAMGVALHINVSWQLFRQSVYGFYPHKRYVSKDSNSGRLADQSTTLAQTEISAIGWLAIQFYTHVQGPQKMNPNNFGEPLPFHLLAVVLEEFPCNSAWTFRHSTGRIVITLVAFDFSHRVKIEMFPILAELNSDG